MSSFASCLSGSLETPKAGVGAGLRARPSGNRVQRAHNVKPLNESRDQRLLRALKEGKSFMRLVNTLYHGTVAVKLWALSWHRVAPTVCRPVPVALQTLASNVAKAWLLLGSGLTHQLTGKP